VADDTEKDNAVSSLLGRLKGSGEQVFNELAQQLLENPTFLAALRRSIEAKERVGRTISGTMDFVNLPSKNDMTAIQAALEHLDVRLAQQQRLLAAIEQRLDEMRAALETLSRAQAGQDHGPA
jgi:ribosomal 50S subunit-associated protein YjgA (DUF615 family)